MSLTSKVKWNGAQLQDAAMRGAQRGLYLWAEHVLEESGRLVPHQEGTLERSGVAHKPRAGELQAAVSYDTPYAVRQHEETTYRHPHGRQAKYLETAVNQSQRVGLELVGREIRKATT